MSEPVKYTADDLERRLEARFKADATEVLFGVRNDAGFNANRTADAIAIGLWPSTGCALQGYEIKVSRGDWLRELKDGAKSAAFLEYMDFWWLVAPREIVNDDELPPAWGQLVPQGEGLRLVRQAKRNPNVAPMPRGMLAAIVKRASTKVARDLAIRAAEDRGFERGKKSAPESYSARRLADLTKSVDEFRKSTGINIEYVYEPERLKLAYALVQSGGHLDVARKLGFAAGTIEKLAADLRKVERDINSSAEAPAKAVA